jgi:hypothetical protein
MDDAARRLYFDLINLYLRVVQCLHQLFPPEPPTPVI